MNGYKYDVTWYHLNHGHGAAIFDKKTDALTYARNLRKLDFYQSVMVYRVSFGCRTRVWGSL